jgi:hypothetical protein
MLIEMREPEFRLSVAVSKGVLYEQVGSGVVGFTLCGL